MSGILPTRRLVKPAAGVLCGGAIILALMRWDRLFILPEDHAALARLTPDQRAVAEFCVMEGGSRFLADRFVKDLGRDRAVHAMIELLREPRFKNCAAWSLGHARDRRGGAGRGGLDGARSDFPSRNQLYFTA